MKEFRCSRRLPHSNPNVPGHLDPSGRQGHYIQATNKAEAWEEMNKRFPQDAEELRCATMDSDNDDLVQWGQNPFDIQDW